LFKEHPFLRPWRAAENVSFVEIWARTIACGLNYTPSPANPRLLTTTPNFGVITSTVNFNIHNDNAASPNTGTGLPRQLQFMLRFKF